MSLIQASSQTNNIKDDPEKFKYIQLFLDQAKNVVNGKIEFGTNINSKTVSVSFRTADTDTSVSHGLGFVPNGYFIVGLSAAMIVYSGTGNPSADSLNLKSNAIGTAQVMFF